MGTSISYSVLIPLFSATFLGFTGLLAWTAAAQDTTPGGPGSACLQAPLKLPDAEVLGFMADPAALFTLAPSDPDARRAHLGHRLRRLVGSGVNALQGLDKVVRTLPEADKKIVGYVLGEIAARCAATKPDVGLAIQSFVAGLKDETVLVAFLSGSQDQETDSLRFVRGPATVATIGNGGVGTASNWGSGASSQGGGSVPSFGASNSFGGGYSSPIARSSSQNRAQP